MIGKEQGDSPYRIYCFHDDGERVGAPLFGLVEHRGPSGLTFVGSETEDTGDGMAGGCLLSPSEPPATVLLGGRPSFVVYLFL